MIEPVPGIEEEEQEIVNQDSHKLQQAWLHRIKEEEKSHGDFRERGRDVQDVFEDDMGSDDELYVPLLWSVVQVEHSGIYSNQPVPDVRPANDEKNPDFRKASDVLARSIGHFVDDLSFDENLHRTIDNYLAIGLGVIRIKLDSQIIDLQVPMEPTPEEAYRMDADQVEQYRQERDGVTEKAIGEQSMAWEFVPWDRFGWEPCNSWRTCEWIYYRHRMTNPQIVKRFGRTVRASKDDKDKSDNTSWKRKTFDIYEVWDKKNRRQLFIAKNELEVLEVNKDPLGLPGFWPGPLPMMTNVTTGELLPKADYDYIEPYDRELNRLQERRMGLLEQIKAVGGHDKGMPELANIYEQQDGESLPIQNLAQRTQGGGFDQVIFQLPLEEKVMVLAKLTEQIQFVKAQVDEILGIADIVRGVSNANEGVGTQELKGKWVGIRLSRKKDLVAYTVREMMRIMAQVITTHFTDENLARMTQVEIEPQVMQLLRNDLMMDFSIDIETDSTVAQDEFQERKTRQEMLGAIGAFSGAVLPLVQQGLMPADVSSAILRSALQPYAKYSRGLDESMADLQSTQQQLQQLNGQIQEGQQKIQTLEGEKQQWQQIAQTLQMQATEAASKQKLADAGKKMAETEKIRSETDDQGLGPLKVASEIDLNQAKTIDTLRQDKPRMN